MGDNTPTDRQGMLADVGVATKTVCGKKSKTYNIHRNCGMGKNTNVYYRTRNYGAVGFTVQGIKTKQQGLNLCCFALRKGMFLLKYKEICDIIKIDNFMGGCL